MKRSRITAAHLVIAGAILPIASIPAIADDRSAAVLVGVGARLAQRAAASV